MVVDGSMAWRLNCRAAQQLDGPTGKWLIALMAHLMFNWHIDILTARRLNRSVSNWHINHVTIAWKLHCLQLDWQFNGLKARQVYAASA